MREVIIHSESIKLDSFLKWSGLVATGGEAKAIVQDGGVLVNGRVELRRGRQLHPGDVVEAFGQCFKIVSE